MVRDAQLGLGFLGVSAALHLVAAMAIFYVPRLPRAFDVPVEVELEGTGAPSPEETPGQVARGRTPLTTGGRRVAQNIDGPSTGQGGDGVAQGPVILLMPRADGVTLSDTPPSALSVSQLSRIRTARDRATQEDRRATPNPSQQAWLASGSGTYAHRRERAAAPASGDPVAGEASVRGLPQVRQRGTMGEQVDRNPRDRRGQGDPQDRRSGSDSASPGRGQVGGTAAGRRGADVALGRPPVDRGPAATAANRRAIRVRDNRNAEQLAAGLVQSFVDSTTRAGTRVGVGSGGVGGGGSPGSGAEPAPGGRAHASGAGGEGAFREDPRYLQWFLEQRRRVTTALVYPHARQLSMDQGTSVYRVMVRRDGSLRARPRLLHGSGYNDLDAAARRAIEDALPFAPIPRELMPDSEWLPVRLAIEFQNPMVH